MKVVLLAYITEPEKLVATAARTCYSDQTPDQIYREINEETIQRRISDCLDSGHHSILEHSVFVFGIEGISRVTSHQLVRHRIASYSQQSQRYVKKKGQLNHSDYITPPTILENDRFLNAYDDLLLKAHDLYQQMINEKIPAEDARYVFPHAMCTNLIVTMNARELLHFFKLRTHKKAQWEIRELASQMRDLVQDVAPRIFSRRGEETKQ